MHLMLLTLEVFQEDVFWSKLVAIAFWNMQHTSLPFEVCQDDISWSKLVVFRNMLYMYLLFEVFQYLCWLKALPQWNMYFMSRKFEVFQEEHTLVKVIEDCTPKHQSHFLDIFDIYLCQSIVHIEVYLYFGHDISCLKVAALERMFFML
jgi:hypothetical protein